MKPRYVLALGDAPYRSMELRYAVGRIQVKISAALSTGFSEVLGTPDPSWEDACRALHRFWTEAPPIPLGQAAQGHGGVRLTEPAERPLHEEIASFVSSGGPR